MSSSASLSHELFDKFNRNRGQWLVDCSYCLVKLWVGLWLGSSKATHTFYLRPQMDFPRSGYFLLLEVSWLRPCDYDNSKYGAFQFLPHPGLILPYRNSPHDRTQPLILHHFHFQTHPTEGRASWLCLPFQGQPRCHQWLGSFLQV